ncbi:MAG: hypothetical protein J6R20_04370 [Clostridia bacterium]|nr:hypothetical protein [Clostridia bacterium]
MKKILALILAFAMLFSFAACGGNEEPETTTAASVEESTDAPEDDAPVADDPSATDPSAVDPSAPESEFGIKEAPATAADILALYNATINRAVAAKVGFNKVRYTDNETLNAGFLLKTFGDLVYSFMGIGAENKYTMDVTKGQWEEDVPHHYLRKSTLSTADITKATCTENNGKYTIKFNVKPGNSKASKNESYNNSPIDKCGICVGDLDKSYFDHKTAPVIYAAVGQVVSGAVIEESYDNATIVAVIDVATGHLVSLTVEYDINVVIDTAGGGNATGSAHVFYKNFKY